MSTCRIACGAAPTGATAWVAYGTNGIYVDVNTASGKFNACQWHINYMGMEV
jgi:hypothetical protein